MSNTTNTRYSLLNRVYPFFSKWFFWLSLLCLVVTLLLDFSSAPYYEWAAVLFCQRDFTHLISTSLACWAFGVSLLVLFLGKIDTRCFGVHLYDVLLFHEGILSLACKLLLFLGELTLLGLSGMYELPITVFAVCLLQPLNIIYILLIVMLELSPGRVVQTIREQTKDVLTHLASVSARPDQPSGNTFRGLDEAPENIDWQQTEEMLTHMAAERARPDQPSGNIFRRLDEELKNTDWLLMQALRSINYYQHADMDTLASYLPADIWSPLADSPDVQLLVSWKLACRMVDGGQESTDGDPKLPLALMEWFRRTVSNPECPFFVREGILAALLLYGEDLSPSLFENLLAAVRDECHGKAVDWNVQLLWPMINGGAHPERKALFHKLEGYREEHGCRPGHVLPLEDKELLDSFRTYVGYRPPSQEEIEDIQRESFTEEEVTINV